MAKQTRRRFGAIRKLPSGRFQARYRAPDGLERRAPETFDTKTDAEVWLTRIEADLIRGTGSVYLGLSWACSSMS